MGVTSGHVANIATFNVQTTFATGFLFYIHDFSQLLHHRKIFCFREKNHGKFGKECEKEEKNFFSEDLMREKHMRIVWKKVFGFS